MPRVNFQLVKYNSIRDLSEAEEHFRETEEHFRELEYSNKKIQVFTSNPIKNYPNDLKINILANFDILNMNLMSDLQEKH